MDATPVGPGYAVVAIDGTEEGYAAVVFAAEEALRHGLALRLAHVQPVYAPPGPMMLAADQGLGAFASETLASALRAATEAAPQLEITTHALVGSRVAQIVGLAEHARFVVVGRRPGGAFDRAWSGGTLDGVVSRARCPVFVAPGTSDRADPPRRVVVGFKSAKHSAELFEAGLRAAGELGAELEILHAWRLAGGYDDIIARRVSEAAWNRDRKDSIRDLFAPWQEACPQVRVRIQVVHQYAVRALVEASRDAERLVLVKPLHGSVVHHLGRTARGALRFAQCPVEVVPARPRGELTLPSLAIEQAGELVP